MKIVCFLSILSISSCIKKPEIVLLCNKGNDYQVQEIYLIKHVPYAKANLKLEIEEYNADFSQSKIRGSRTFLKEHDNALIPILGDLVLRDNIDYEKTKCEDIDNMDFVAQVTKYQKYIGIDTIEYNYFDQ